MTNAAVAPHRTEDRGEEIQIAHSLDQLIEVKIVRPCYDSDNLTDEFEELRISELLPCFYFSAELVVDADGEVMIPRGTYMTDQDGNVFKAVCPFYIDLTEIEVYPGERYMIFKVEDTLLRVEGTLITEKTADAKEDAIPDNIRALVEYVRSCFINVPYLIEKPIPPSRIAPDMQHYFRYAFVTDFTQKWGIWQGIQHEMPNCWVLQIGGTQIYQYGETLYIQTRDYLKDYLPETLNECVINCASFNNCDQEALAMLRQSATFEVDLTGAQEFIDLELQSTFGFPLHLMKHVLSKDEIIQLMNASEEDPREKV